MTNGDEERAMNGGCATSSGSTAASGAAGPGGVLEPSGTGASPAAARLEGDGVRPGADGERSILQAIAVGDHRGALSLCARYHGPAVGRLCMALVGSQAEADDLTQETLLTAHDGFAAYRGEGSLRAWLFGIARRKCARAVERRVRREARLRLVHDSDRAPPTEELIARRRRAERARAALDAVRPTEREALVLRFVSDLSYREVAEACGIDEVAARKRVSRAITRLRAALAEDE
ncbi:MAG TPA: RNA polymerase sigma factor [Polyangiaceae bacterium]|nr:RNA polymerase sigma factor [Polyangiaceae bacterium]